MDMAAAYLLLKLKLKIRKRGDTGYAGAADTTLAQYCGAAGVAGWRMLDTG
jgi:hypothetical protein